MTDPQIAKLKMRCSRRGIKEMDVIMGKFAQTELVKMSGPELIALEEMLEENDHEILAWILGRSEPPARFLDLIGKVKTHNAL